MSIFSAPELVTGDKSAHPEVVTPTSTLDTISHKNIIYHYQALAENTFSLTGIINTGKFNWYCSNKKCSISGPWITPGLSACKALAIKIGRISSYGHSAAKLNNRQLEQCNLGVKPSEQSLVQKKLESQNEEDSSTKLTVVSSRTQNNAKEQKKPKSPVKTDHTADASVTDIPMIKIDNVNYISKTYTFKKTDQITLEATSPSDKNFIIIKNVNYISRN